MRTKISWFRLVFTVIGAITGFLYWKFIGCTTGTCPIKSVWYLSTLWGTATGYLLGDIVGSIVVKYGERNDKKI